jgi:hypothetical protein
VAVAVLSLTVAEARGPVVWLGRDDGGAEGPVAHVVLDAAQGECRLRASLRVAGVVGARVWRLVEGRVWRLVEVWVSVAEAAPGSVLAVADRPAAADLSSSSTASSSSSSAARSSSPRAEWKS